MINSGGMHVPKLKKRYSFKMKKKKHKMNEQMIKVTKKYFNQLTSIF